MIRYGVLIAMLFCIGVVAGQSNMEIVRGKIIDSAGRQPLPGVTVSLSGSKVHLDVLSDSVGNYLFRNLSPGEYSIQCVSIGYKKYSSRFTISRNQSSLPLIRLVTQYAKLNEVVVTGQKKLIENKIDRIVFNAENDLTSLGGVATDILKKIPQVSVDVDGNVELAGSSSIKFLINGKPSTAFGNNITDVLQSIPASEIKQVEVMTSPGAKYDAEGSGGVINIILKSNPTRGLNSSLSLTAGTRIENGTLNVTARTEKLSVNFFTGYNTKLPAQTLTSAVRNGQDSTGTSLLTQQMAGKIRRYGSESGVSMEWSPDSTSTITAGVNYNLFGNNISGTIHAIQTITPIDSAANTSTFDNQSHSAFQFYSTDVNLGYKKTFAKPERSLEAAMNSSFGNNDAQSSYLQTGFPDKDFESANQIKSRGKEAETEITVDYTTPIAEGTVWNAGVKTSLRNIKSLVNGYAQNPDGSLVDDANLSNQLTYHQEVYAAYSELQIPIKKWLSIKGGLRYERTQIHGEYFAPAKSTVAQGYNTWVPSIYAFHKLGEDQQIKISYTRRIDRPDFGDLNPYINTSDPKNLVSGNPLLRPEKGQRIELAYSHDFHPEGSASIALFYRSSSDDIQPYITYYPSFTVGDTSYQNVSVSRRENIGLEKNIGVNVFSDVTIWTKLYVRADLFFFRRFTTNLIDPGFNVQSSNYRINLNLSYRFPNNLAAEFFGNFRSPRNEAQGRYPSFTNYSFAFRKQIWNKKGSIGLTAINPFNRYVRQETLLFGPGFQIQSVRNIPFRSIGVNFTWRFGRLQFKKDAQPENPVQGE